MKGNSSTSYQTDFHINPTIFISMKKASQNEKLFSNQNE
ncbi:hypothetical protein P23_1968 [Acinetobacter calcoaceticus]|nr:hypothetical protein P23_1968 [Acinetobacter calcoaceticus]